MATLRSFVAMRSFRTIIDAYTVKYLATVLGVPENHVRTMRTRDSIPPEYWTDLVNNAPEALSELRIEHLATLRKLKSSSEQEHAA